MVPALATALVNQRIHPTQSVAEVLEFNRRAIDDPRVKLKVIVEREPMPASPYGPDDIHYQLVSKTIDQTFEDVITVPSM